MIHLTFSHKTSVHLQYTYPLPSCGKHMTQCAVSEDDTQRRLEQLRQRRAEIQRKKEELMQRKQQNSEDGSEVPVSSMWFHMLHMLLM